MHTDKQSGDTNLRIAIGFFFDIISRKLIYLVYNQIPTAQVKIAYAEIDTFNAGIGYDVLKTLCELQVYIVEYSSHQLSQPLTPNGGVEGGVKEKRESYHYSSRNL